ncbi:MAG: glycosyltransferase, partial [Patescibacteria group bacterium]
MSRYLLLTLEHPPQIGGVARMYGALAATLKDSITVLVDRSTLHPTGSKLLFRYLWPHWLATFFVLIRWWRPGREILVGQVLPLGIPVWLLSYVRTIRYTVLVHGMDITAATSIPRRRWMIRQICRRAARVVAANAYVATAVGRLDIPELPVQVLYPIPAAYGDSTAAQSQKQMILSVGRLVKRKGFDTLLTAMETVWHFFPRVELQIVGDGPERQRLESLVGTKPQVQFRGLLPDASVANLMRQATIFCLTPRTVNGAVEGFGIVYLEAASFGLPVVATRHGGIPEAVVDGETG